MPTGDKDYLLTQIANDLPDNNTGDIEPADLRTVESALVTYTLNTAEGTQQTVAGVIDFVSRPLFNGVPLAYVSNNDDKHYVMRNGEWTGLASFLATTNSVIPINGDSVNPSFLPIDLLIAPDGVEIGTAAEGSVKNISGRLIRKMTGSVSFNPDVTGGGTKRIVIVSETSIDNQVTWQGNLNSIRKVEIGSATESFKTNVSLLIDWPDQAFLRFRAFDETGAGLDLVPESGTIMGQPFTGPALVWDLSEH